ncbi:MAG: peroxiredoxin-like family protein [Roseiflexaceae bacterium]
MTTTPLPAGVAAPDVQLQSTEDAPVQLAQFWQRTPALIFFVRHVGCVFCREQVRTLAQRYDEIRVRGAEVVAIIPTDTINAARFARSMRLPYPVLCDMPRRAFAAFGLYETTIGELAQPEVVLRTARQFARGNIPLVSPFSSSLTQLGGVFIVGSDGIVRLGHAATPVFTYPALDTCLAVLDSLQLSRA